MTAHDIGIVVAPPGFGKTVLGCHLISRRGRSTLVVVHRTELLEQWVAQLSLFLGVAASDIGRLGGGRRRLVTRRIDVATYQSLVRLKGTQELVASYGHVVVDECHHVPAFTLEKVLRGARARYVLGLTATPRRRDGHDPIATMQLGPVRYRQRPRAAGGQVAPVRQLVVRRTGVTVPVGEEISVHDVYRQLVDDDGRNDLIVRDVVQAVEQGRSPLVLTERRHHLDVLAARLRPLVGNLVVLSGGMGGAERGRAASQLARPGSRVVVATGRFAGEGFDDARLDTLLLVLPVSWKELLVQYAGRLHRTHDGKRVVRVIDYLDEGHPMLERMFANRQRGYRSMGYVVAEDGDASAGRGQLALRFEDTTSATGRSAGGDDELGPGVVSARVQLPTQLGADAQRADGSYAPPIDEIDRMIDDATEAAFGPIEEAEALLYLLERELDLPCPAALGGEPARIIELRLARPGRIVAVCRSGKRRRHVPLEALEAVATTDTDAPLGWAWVEAYRRWVHRASTCVRTG